MLLPRSFAALVLLLLAADRSAAQVFGPSDFALPMVVQVATPQGVPAGGTQVSVLGTQATGSADWRGRAVLPGLHPGDYVLLLERTGEATQIVGVSASGLGDSFAVRLVRRAPRVGEFTTVNVISPELVGLDVRRSAGLGQLMAGSRLRLFGSVLAAARFLAGPALLEEACIRVGLDGRAPAGARLFPVYEPARWIRQDGPIVAPVDRTEPQDAEQLRASPERLQAIEWFDSRLVPALFEGIPAGCHVLFLWH